MNFIYIPNIITAMRIILVLPFLYCMFNNQYIAAFIFGVIAGLSDSIDGYLARKYDWITRLGTFSDPIADKLLLVSGFIALAALQQVSLGVMSLVLARDVFIIVGAGAYYFTHRQIELQPNFISKLNTVFQIMFVFLLVFELAFAAVSDWLISMMLLLVVITTILSFLTYVWVWSAKTEVSWQIGAWKCPKILGVAMLLSFTALVTIAITAIVYHYVALLQ